MSNKFRGDKPIKSQDMHKPVDPSQEAWNAYLALKSLFQDTGFVDGQEDLRPNPDQKRANAALLNSIDSVVKYGSDSLGMVESYYKASPDFVPERVVCSAQEPDLLHRTKTQRDAILATGLFNLRDHQQYAGSGNYHIVTIVEPKSPAVQEMLKIFLKDGEGKDQVNFTDRNKIVDPHTALRLCDEYKAKKIAAEKPEPSPTITGLHLRRRAAELLLGRS